MKFIRTSILVIVVALISSAAGSFVTLKLIDDRRYETKTEETVEPREIISDGSTKNQNVYQAVAEKASPSVVGIVSEAISNESVFVKQVEQGVGTGFVIDKRGYIMTNSHVVSDGRAETVRVILSDNRDVEGKVIWFDTSLDLAVVKVNVDGLVPAELGNSDRVRVGDIAIAIGNPLGTELLSSVTQGIISGLNRDVSTKTVNMSGLMQTDASINPGNSGGPLLNQEGQVIGINTAKANADNLGFSIPINTAKLIAQKVIEDKNYKKPIIGISGIDVKTYNAYTNSNLSAKHGVVVRYVEPGSSAHLAGLNPGDIIVKIGDADIKYMGDISKKMYTYSKGDKDKIIIIRNGKTKQLDIEIN